MTVVIITVTSHKGESSFGSGPHQAVVGSRLSDRGERQGRGLKACGIYRIRNLTNGKCYVGSALDVSARLYNHRWHLENETHRNRKPLNAWRKYGSAV
ncbi:MAG: GIY-YIG nuclease family protein, partial [Actinomycetota bacterium]